MSCCGGPENGAICPCQCHVPLEPKSKTTILPNCNHSLAGLCAACSVAPKTTEATLTDNGALLRAIKFLEAEQREGCQGDVYEFTEERTGTRFMVDVVALRALGWSLRSDGTFVGNDSYEAWRDEVAPNEGHICEVEWE